MDFMFGHRNEDCAPNRVQGNYPNCQLIRRTYSVGSVMFGSANHNDTRCMCYFLQASSSIVWRPTEYRVSSKFTDIIIPLYLSNSFFLFSEVPSPELHAWICERNAVCIVFFFYSCKHLQLSLGRKAGWAKISAKPTGLWV